MGDVSLALAKRNNNIVTPVRVKEIQDAPLREFTTPLATMTCGTLMTPVCIRSLYDIPKGTKGDDLPGWRSDHWGVI